MIVTTQQLKEQYRKYVDINGKIARDVKKEKLFPLVKGIYETNPNTNGSRLAQFIYGQDVLEETILPARLGFQTRVNIPENEITTPN